MRNIIKLYKNSGSFTESRYNSLAGITTKFNSNSLPSFLTAPVPSNTAVSSADFEFLNAFDLTKQVITVDAKKGISASNFKLIENDKFESYHIASDFQFTSINVYGACRLKIVTNNGTFYSEVFEILSDK